MSIHMQSLPKWASEGQSFTPDAPPKKRHFRSRFLRRFLFTIAFALVTLRLLDGKQRDIRIRQLEHGLEQCDYISQIPGPRPGFHGRTRSDRFEPGTPSVWIRNATLWTGDHGGHESYVGDVVLDGGVMKYVGKPRDKDEVRGLLESSGDMVEIDAGGRWVTPGIVDAHTHAGLEGGNSFVNNIHPYLQVLDTLDFTKPDFQLITAGGVTTSLLLPGSAVGIGGQAFTVKFRPTAINSPAAKLVEPPYLWTPGDSMSGRRIPEHWRHMKHALGENPDSVFKIVRMDNIWEMRKAYSAAKEWQTKQKDWCSAAVSAQSSWNLKAFVLGQEGVWPWEKERGAFPTAPLEHESLVDVLNGKVKLNVHSYEVTDFDALVRMSNEFGIEVAGVHHAHEAWLAPELLKGMYKHPPAVCIFSSFSMYKRESFRWSPFAPRILTDAGLEVIMKSDHSGVVARYLPREAAIAHQWGLDEVNAMKSITSHPAKAIGLDHRVGYLRKGYDADVVIWQGHPLAVGSAPLQVYVDGIPQIENPAVHSRSPFTDIPPTGHFPEQMEYEIESKGTPDLSPRSFYDSVLFRNVKYVWLRRNGTIQNLNPGEHLVDVQIGKAKTLECLGQCLDTADHSIDLEGGSILPGLIAAGANLGLGELDLGDATASEGEPDLTPALPHRIMDFSLRQAADVVAFGQDKLHRAIRNGFTYSVTAPNVDGSTFIRGVSCLMRIGAIHSLDGGIPEEQIALHVKVDAKPNSPAGNHVQLNTLRSLLTDSGKASGTPLGSAIQAVRSGKLPLVAEVLSANTMARLITLKAEVEAESQTKIRMVFHGATEAWLLAKEIKEAGISVIVAPMRSFPYSTAEAKALPGVPLSHETVISTLWKAGVKVGVGMRNDNPPFTSAAFTFRWDLYNAMMDTTADIPPEEWYKMATTNLEEIFGFDNEMRKELEGDFVAVKAGNLLNFGGTEVVAFSSGTGVSVF